MKLKYFAWVRERIGMAEEEVELPPQVATARDLLDWLKGRGDGYAEALRFPEAIRVAIDHEHVRHDARIAGAGEIALFPPMTGGMKPVATASAPVIRIQSEPFDAEAETARLTRGRTDVGAVVGFLGLCRDEGGRLAALELEHYPGMAEAEIGRIAAQAAQRWPLLGLVVVHRHGVVAAGEAIVLVAAASTHRQAAFEAASFLMDFLKTRAPFWKREHLADGTVGGWVEAAEADDEATARWDGFTRR